LDSCILRNWSGRAIAQCLIHKPANELPYWMLALMLLENCEHLLLGRNVHCTLNGRSLFPSIFKETHHYLFQQRRDTKITVSSIDFLVSHFLP
jgi:hypothetical protein